MNIVILAAGKGSRMCSRIPKVLQPLAGKPLLAHVLDSAWKMAPQRVVVVIGHGGEVVQQHFLSLADISKNECTLSSAIKNIHWVTQQAQRGTAHAVFQTISHLDTTLPTLILYGDVPLISHETLQKLVSFDAPLSILTAKLENPQGYGRIIREASTAIHHESPIVKIVEDQETSAQERSIKEINTGILWAHTAALEKWLIHLLASPPKNAQGEYFLTDVVSLAVSQCTTIASTQPTHEWEALGINNPVQLATAERRFQYREAEKLMVQGVRLADPSRFDLRANTIGVSQLLCDSDVSIDVNALFVGAITLGEGVEIGPNCYLEGPLKLGKGVCVGTGCFLRNSQIGSGSQIFNTTTIDGAWIGEKTRVGPYARIRPDTYLGNEAQVGNFVEMKNTRMGSGSKANHLSYLGDAKIGEQVNLGAGTITCNFDGMQKHQTVIGDHAFVGSGTELIAPVTVGAGAFIGAGTTLTREAPENALTLSRVRQKTVVRRKPTSTRKVEQD